MKIANYFWGMTSCFKSIDTQIQALAQPADLLMGIFLLYGKKKGSLSRNAILSIPLFPSSFDILIFRINQSMAWKHNKAKLWDPLIWVPRVFKKKKLTGHLWSITAFSPKAAESLCRSLCWTPIAMFWYNQRLENRICTFLLLLTDIWIKLCSIETRCL